MNRHILITGGNGGLGLAVARAFLDESPANHVWLGVRRQRDAAEALAGDRCRLLDLDVTDATAWSSAVQAMGCQVDVLVNNAGTHDDALLAMMPESSFRSVVDANLTGTFLGCQAVVKPMMGRRHGRIVNISSLSALLAPAGQTNYAAAKAGVVALTQSLAKEVARAGITVNAVCPGYIETAALSGMDADQRKAKAAAIPMRRFGKPEEVAAAVRFLASGEAGYITGAVLKIDGGIF